MAEATEQTLAQARPIAVIDIGANSVRMVVAQVLPDGELEVLERMRRPVRLGQDTYVRGRLGQETMNAAIGILRDYKRMLDDYQVREVRAVATSAVREAANADAFLDRAYMATHLDLEVIESTEESRLTVGAVLHAVGGAHNLLRNDTLIVDIGGGNALLTVMRNGQIVSSASHRLGSIRMQEVLSTSQEPAERAADLLRHQVATLVGAIRTSLPLKRVRRFIAVGGDARFAAQQIGRHWEAADLSVMNPKDFAALVDQVAGHAPEELARRYALPFADAETLVPALIGYQALFNETHAKEIVVSNVSMRDGLLLDLARARTGELDESLAESTLQSALTIGRKYGFDAAHAEHVANLSVRIFDELQRDHGLSARHRLLLRTAALLHEIGGFVSGRAHHKHSYYLIANSEVFGLRRNELQIVAHTARYHRRSSPKPSHLEYMNLPRDSRIIVSKLAAILRVADALDRGHAQQIRDIRFERRGDELVLHVAGVPDLMLERRALASKADLFTDMYGMKIRLEEDTP